MATDIQTQIKHAAARNTELLSTLTQTDYASPSLKEQERYIGELKAEIAASDKLILELEKKRKIELSEHEKYRDSNVKRFLHKIVGQRNKFDAKAAKEEREYFEVLQAEHEAQTLNANLQQQLQDATTVRTQLDEAKAVHDAAQRELDGLYDSIFSGSNSSFPLEDELERKSDQALQRYHDTRVDKEEKDKILQLLEKAQGQADIAIREMDEAHSRSHGDIMGRGMFNDIQKHDALDQAFRAISMAQTLVKRAGLEGAPRVNIDTGGLMSDIFFDNIFTDLARNEEIKRGENEVIQFRLYIVRERGKAINVQGVASAMLREAEVELEKARNELQLERQSVFERVLTDKSQE